MRRVLMVAYYFPPAGGSGVQRTLKFVRYLAEYGWQPVVLTARGAAYPARDPTLEQEIPPEVKVTRAWIPEPYGLYRWFTGRSGDEALDVAVLSRGEAEWRRPAERLAEWARATFFIPDARLGWLPFAVLRGLQLIRQEGIQALYTSAPPYTCHLVGLWLKRLTGLPWVADFRDSWVGWVSGPAWRPPPARAIDLAMERSVVREADWRLAASPAIISDLRSRSIEDPGKARRWTVLTNGFDPQDFSAPDGEQLLSAAYNQPPFTIVHTGSLYGLRSLGKLLEALGQISRQTPGGFAQVRLRLVGRLDAALAIQLSDLPNGVQAEIIPYTAHAGSVRYLLEAHLLLLVVDTGRHAKAIVPGKLYEYLGARRPILVLGPPQGLAARLVSGLGAGWAVDGQDPAGIAAVLLNCLGEWQAGRLFTHTANPHRLAPFQRRNLTRRLARILDRLTVPQAAS